MEKVFKVGQKQQQQKKNKKKLRHNFWGWTTFLGAET